LFSDLVVVLWKKRGKKEWQKKSREKKKVLCKIQKFHLGRNFSEACVLGIFNLGTKVRHIYPHILLGLHQLDFSTSPFFYPTELHQKPKLVL